MAGLGFKSRFAEPILAGTKVGTIRAIRKRPIKLGETLYLFTGMRTKHCKKIGEKTARFVVPISIHASPVDNTTPRVVYGGEDTITAMAALAASGEDIITAVTEATPGEISGRLTTATDLDTFARADGFTGWADMIAFWHKEHPETVTETFNGTWILWEKPLV